MNLKLPQKYINFAAFLAKKRPNCWAECLKYKRQIPGILPPLSAFVQKVATEPLRTPILPHFGQKMAHLLVKKAACLKCRHQIPGILPPLSAFVQKVPKKR